MNVDIVVLTADEKPLRSDVWNAIQAQAGPVAVKSHRQIGQPRSSDSCRWETIARARNEGKRLGIAPYVMFVDDDVVLQPGCVQALVEFLEGHHLYGAAGADYLGEMRPRLPARHVAMGATMFRRSALAKIDFRWESEKCECQCCCDDLRGQLIGIDYVPQAKAVHLARGVRAHQHRSIIPGSDGSAEPRIIVALDRHHFNLLCSQFIPSLRASGNNEVVSVVGYGFYASQQRKLARFPNIGVHSLPISTVHPMMKRLDDFQRVVEQLPSQTPVAFWDAGDAMFQQELKPLWSLILQEPEKFHTVTEPTEDYTESWVCAIQDASLRNSFRRWVSMYGILNGGFGAATASTMLLYLKEADRIYNDLALLEDQTAMNIYCHSDPSRWKRIEEGWNYCLCNRDRREVRFAEDGRLVSTKCTPIYVAHGNGRTFQHYFARSNSSWLARYRAHSAIA